jgi:N utilization substance protein A
MSNQSNHVPSPALRDHRSKVAHTVEAIDALTAAHRAALAANGVNSLDDLADLASDELRDIIGPLNMSRDIADQVIMAARAHWFESAT